MRILKKVYYNDLRCPNCASTQYHLLNGNSFVCECCDQTFSFDLQRFNLNSGNNERAKELVENFYIERARLYEIKKRNYQNLLHYKKIANPNGLYIFSIVWLTISILGLFSLILTWLMLICCIASGICFAIAVKRKKRIYETYKEKISEYAKKVAECQERIDVYDNLISKLTK